MKSNIQINRLHYYQVAYVIKENMDRFEMSVMLKERSSTSGWRKILSTLSLPRCKFLSSL